MPSQCRLYEGSSPLPGCRPHVGDIAQLQNSYPYPGRLGLGLCSNLTLPIPPSRRFQWVLPNPDGSTKPLLSPFSPHGQWDISTWTEHILLNPPTPSLLFIIWSLFLRMAAPSFHLPKLGTWDSASARALFHPVRTALCSCRISSSSRAIFSSLTATVGSHHVSP